MDGKHHCFSINSEMRETRVIMAPSIAMHSINLCSTEKKLSRTDFAALATGVTSEKWFTLTSISVKSTLIAHSTHAVWLRRTQMSVSRRLGFEWRGIRCVLILWPFGLMVSFRAHVIQCFKFLWFFFLYSNWKRRFKCWNLIIDHEQLHNQNQQHIE